VVIDGNLNSSGDLQIDGTINGDVRARAAVVDFNGVVHGEVIAEEVIVRGRVIGHIRGIHVQIYSGGHVEGDVINETISIDQGAYIDGKIRRSDNPLGDAETEEEARNDPFSHIRPRRPLSVVDDHGYRSVDFLRRPPKAAE
jgi:cytoskeletal protein CcmA (bactofilin family)